MISPVTSFQNKGKINLFAPKTEIRSHTVDNIIKINKRILLIYWFLIEYRIKARIITSEIYIIIKDTILKYGFITS